MINPTKVHVLGVVGSPRKGGNTEILVDEILSGAEKNGAVIEKVMLNELSINPCQACDSCYKTGKCMHNDDMIDLLKKMENSELWVLGTPIYWWGPTAQFKTFLDRWYCPQHKTFKGKYVILAIPFEGGHSKYARHTVGLFKDVLEYLSIELLEIVLAPGTGNRGAVREKDDLMTKAYNAGQKAIETINKSQD
ncbi:MAG: flavodoxin family protein [Candidatus Thorarchaeota archaeon]